jgi:hypothetical protein
LAVLIGALLVYPEIRSIRSIVFRVVVLPCQLLVSHRIIPGRRSLIDTVKSFTI